jgi:O-antigen ligase
MNPAMAVHTVAAPRNAAAWRTMASWVLLWEAPFWVILVYCSLVPASQVPRQEWFGIPMRLSDIMSLASASYYGVLGICLYVLGRARCNAAPILLTTGVLVLYGFLRLVSGPLELEDQLGMGFALLLVASAPIQAAGVLSAYNASESQRFMNRVTLFLAMISVLYTAESVFGLGLRTELGNTLSAGDFGIQRVRGPLYGASTGYLMLLPAIGWSMAGLFGNVRGKFRAGFCAVGLLSAYLGLGSRAGLILLAMFVTAVVVLLRRLKQTGTTEIVLAALCLAAGAFVFTKADTDRLKSFEDVHRRLTYETSWTILTTEPLLDAIAGQGYGTIWPWYRRDLIKADLVAIGGNTVMTGFGTSLYHAHSTLLELAVEFGLLGLVWLLYLVVRTARLPFLARASTGWRVFALALLISFCALPFDLFLFKEVRVSSIWWLFLIAALQLPRNLEGDAI